MLLYMSLFLDKYLKYKHKYLYLKVGGDRVTKYLSNNIGFVCGKHNIKFSNYTENREYFIDRLRNSIRKDYKKKLLEAINENMLLDDSNKEFNLLDNYGNFVIAIKILKNKDQFITTFHDNPKALEICTITFNKTNVDKTINTLIDTPPTTETPPGFFQLGFKTISFINVQENLEALKELLKSINIDEIEQYFEVQLPLIEQQLLSGLTDIEPNDFNTSLYSIKLTYFDPQIKSPDDAQYGTSKLKYHISICDATLNVMCRIQFKVKEMLISFLKQVKAGYIR